jgi:hypothetical protein
LWRLGKRKIIRKKRGVACPHKDVERKEFATGGQAIHQAGSVFIELFFGIPNHPVEPVDLRNDTFPHGIEHDFRCTVEAQFLHHVGSMGLNCSNA